MPSHDFCRKRVCLLCSLPKAKKTLSDAKISDIRIIVGSGFDLSDERFPLGICPTCVRYVDEEVAQCFPGKHSFSLFDHTQVHLPHETRSASGICHCVICKMVPLNKPPPKKKKAFKGTGQLTSDKKLLRSRFAKSVSPR